MAKYETTVGSVTTPMFEVEAGNGRDTVATVAFEGEYPQVPKLLEAAYNGLAVKLPAAYNYARDHYSLGLPEGFKQLPIESIDDIRSTIESIVGYSIEVVTIFGGPPDPEYFADRYANYNWGLLYEEQVLTISPIGISDVDYPSRIIDATFSSANIINIGVKYGPDGSDYKSISISDDLITHNPQSKYYQVRYRPLNADTTQVDYFVYEIGSGVYPSLDSENTEKVFSPFLPIIPIRQDGKNMGSVINADGTFRFDSNGSRIKPNTDLYRTSVKLCKLLDVEFDDVCKALYSGDVDEIDHAYLNFGIDVKTKTRMGKKYLYLFFDEMVNVFGRGINTFEVKDAYYRVEFSWQDLEKTVEQGILDDDVVIELSGPNLIIKTQLLGGYHDKIIVRNLEYRNFVYKEYSVDLTLLSLTEEDTFHIPLNYYLVSNDNSLFDRADLIKESFVITLNSYNRRKLKWYESTWFKAILIIAAFATAVYTLGASLAYINTAYAAGGILAAAQAAGWLILQSLVIKLGIQWLSSYVSPEVLVLLEVVLIVTALSGNLSDNSFWDAERLLSLSQSVNEGVEMGIEDAMQQIQDDMDELTNTIKIQTEELEELEASLDVSTDWFKEIIADKIDIPVIESPEEFYTRTIHTGNIGVSSLHIIDNYVDNALKLPKLRNY